MTPPIVAASPSVATKLIAWHETQSIDTGFGQPRAIALSSEGKLFVAGDRVVRAFSADGCAERKITVGGDAYCIAIATDGRLIVGLKDRIEIWSPKGDRMAQWEPLGKGAHLTSLAARGDSVWAGDAGNRVALQYDANGKIIGRFGESPADRLVMPSPHLDVHLDAQGALWLNNPGKHRLQAHAENGEITRTWGTPAPEIKGFCGCCNPTDFAFLPDGRFVTAEKGIPRIKVYAADGTFQNVVAGAESFSGDNISLDLAVTADGRVYVLDPERKAVRVFEPNEGGLPQKPQGCNGLCPQESHRTQEAVWVHSSPSSHFHQCAPLVSQAPLSSQDRNLSPESFCAFCAFSWQISSDRVSVLSAATQATDGGVDHGG